MWLLKASTRQLQSFQENAIPPYVILSHTWGEEEVSFKDIHRRSAKAMEGYKKIDFACKQALRGNVSWVWIDTCCIDKSSSAELSEAINSMYRWCQNALECYVYLSDVPERKFADSRWFTRGWTLQELLAPRIVVFYARNGRPLGTKTELAKQIAQITRIDEEILIGKKDALETSVAKRMSWASRRKTTRTEDVAYCLLGIFDINMPLIYGESDKAFRRLQEEIIKNSDDQSIFAWGYLSDYPPNRLRFFDTTGPLATSPTAFENSGSIVPDELCEHSGAYAMTHIGLRITLQTVSISSGLGLVAVLACRPETQLLSVVAFPVNLTSLRSGNHVRGIIHGVTGLAGSCFIVPRDRIFHEPKRTILCLSQSARGVSNDIPMSENFIIRSLPRELPPLRIMSVEPREFWNSEQRIIVRHAGDKRISVVRLSYSTGKSYTILLETFNLYGVLYNGYHVLEEASDSIVSYEAILAAYQDERADSLLEPYRTKDIAVIVGSTIRTSTGLVLRPIDIITSSTEAESFTTESSLSGEG